MLVQYTTCTCNLYSPEVLYADKLAEAYISSLNKIQHAAVTDIFGFFKLLLCLSDFLFWNWKTIGSITCTTMYTLGTCT